MSNFSFEVQYSDKSCHPLTFFIDYDRFGVPRTKIITVFRLHWSIHLLSHMIGVEYCTVRSFWPVQIVYWRKSSEYRWHFIHTVIGCNLKSAFKLIQSRCFNNVSDFIWNYEYPRKREHCNVCMTQASSSRKLLLVLVPVLAGSLGYWTRSRISQAANSCIKDQPKIKQPRVGVNRQFFDQLKFVDDFI